MSFLERQVEELWLLELAAELRGALAGVPLPGPSATGAEDGLSWLRATPLFEALCEAAESRTELAGEDWGPDAAAADSWREERDGRERGV